MLCKVIEAVEGAIRSSSRLLVENEKVYLNKAIRVFRNRFNFYYFLAPYVCSTMHNF
jgi:hypothetical protein